jgi:hypothetical protein
MNDTKDLCDLIYANINNEKISYNKKINEMGINELLDNVYNMNIIKEICDIITKNLSNCFDIEELRVMYKLSQNGIFLQTLLEYILKLDYIDFSNSESKQIIHNFCSNYLKQNNFR